MPQVVFEPVLSIDCPIGQSAQFRLANGLVLNTTPVMKIEVLT